MEIGIQKYTLIILKILLNRGKKAWDWTQSLAFKTYFLYKREVWLFLVSMLSVSIHRL